MKTYYCRISDPTGKITKTTRTGKSKTVVSTTLLNEGFFPVTINEKKRGNSFNRNSFKRIFPDFAELLSELLDSGLGIKDSLAVMKAMKNNREITNFIIALEKELNRGASFENSVNATVPGLPSFYTELIGTGEATGNMALALKKLSGHISRKKKMYNKLLGASIYPLMVMVVTVLSLVLISTFIIPQLKEIFAGFGPSVPPKTIKTLTAAGLFIHGFISSAVFTIIIALLLFYLAKRNKVLAETIEKLKLKLPFAGSFIQDLSLLHILFALETLTACGISMERSVMEAGKGSGNIVFSKAFNRIHGKIVTGIKLSEALSTEDIIPGRIVKWSAAGEETGDMESIFKNLALHYENEINRKSSRFAGIIEPALILFTGLIVFAIVLLIVVPLFSSFGSLLG